MVVVSKPVLTGVLASVFAVTSVFASASMAVANERYEPSIWVDPDGCQHWVMDDGAEGYMSPIMTRDGRPVCNWKNNCGSISSDQLFATNSASISATGRARLTEFFQSNGASAYLISGHTDSRASDEYNLALSERRAEAVAKIARDSGAHIAQSVGYGERQPKASNATSSGMAQNRRVEIQCVN